MSPADERAPDDEGEARVERTSLSPTAANVGQDAPAIDVAGLRFGYGARGDGFRLEIGSLRVERGAAVACVGPSGSGKSTFLGLVSGNLLARTGAVRTLGAEWARLSEAARRLTRIGRLGLVFQEFALLDHLSVEENVLLPFLVHPRLPLGSAERERARALAAACGIERYLGDKPRSLSQGERQRVALCRALVTRPELVLADEPTGNLDPETAALALELLHRERRERGATLIVVTHDHSLLEGFDRVLDFARYARRESAAAPDAGGAR